MRLVIVESPTKAKTIGRFLGKDYQVKSSFGHVRDLPKSELGVDTEHDFRPRYVIPTKARKTITELKKSAEAADVLIMATDEDREGEAIAWHLAQALGLGNSKSEIRNPKPVERIVFHEITKDAIEKALKNPREIDTNLVDAQQARRILDRLVGYKLSPFLWKKILRGLSAGRVQSVAVRFVVDREREIEKFVPEEYWSIAALLRQLKVRDPARSEARPTERQKLKVDGAKNEFTANLIKKDGKTIPKLGIKIQDEAEKIIKKLEGAEYRVSYVEKKEVTRSPLPPYTTSTLQQDAWRRLRFSTKQTMRIAQQLYEGINLGKGSVGLITYMRTDSVYVAESAMMSAKEYVEKTHGERYHFWRAFKTKSRLAQEAHEAIRPTDPARAPEAIESYLDAGQYKLDDLIWRRFVASQMAKARFDSTTVDIETKNSEYTFRTWGQIMKFDGFLKVYPMKFEENELPELSEGEILGLLTLTPHQHFTQPLPRFTEATLVKQLEKEGIGRPSTYAPIMSTIQNRGYVEKNEKKYFVPTEIGILVNDMLVTHFPEVVDVTFTAEMEEHLDEIARGKTEWTPIVKGFYEPFEKRLAQKYESVEKQDLTQESNETCEKCGKPMVIKLGRFGKFLACSGFPECKNTKNIEVSTGVSCPKCGAGEIIEKKSKRRRSFYGCNQWPKCDFALWSRPTGEKCPECKSLLVEEREKVKCSNKQCR